MLLRYQLEMPQPAGHGYRVRCHLPKALPGQRLRLPAWIPGSYLIRDFARHVVTVEACDDSGQAVPVTKLDKSTWQVGHAGGPLNVAWEVYARDTSVRGAYLDGRWGFFNGSSLFLEPLDVAVTEIEVDVAAPCANWRLATALDPVAVDEQGFGRYRAADYETLIDCPALMGPLAQQIFTVAGVTHVLWALDADPQADLARLGRDLARICAWQGQLFGEPLPMDRYHFLLRLAGDGYGGLEHRTSCALLAQRKTLPQVEESVVSEDYAELLGLMQPRVFPCLACQADPARAARGCGPERRDLYAPVVGVRGHHLVLRRSGAGALRLHRGVAVPRSARAYPDPAAAHPWPLPAKRCGGQLRCLDQAVQAR